MGSPISFSGFNQIDFNLILNSVMNQERMPLTRLETQKKTLETQNTAFGTLAGKLATADTAISKLKEADSLALLSATSSDAGVGVSATSGTITGTYDVVVSELARAQVTASQTTYAAPTTVAATGGTFTLTPASGPAVTITISASTTVSQLAAAINAEEDSPAAASIVQTSPGSYQLVLTGKETGSTNAFTVNSALTGGAGANFTTNAQAAADAEFTVNGLDVTSASNTVTDVIAGVTLSLLKKDPTTTATVKVTRDPKGAKDLVGKFVSAYNDLVTFSKDQGTAAIAGKASIGRDPLLRGLRDSLRQAMSDEYPGGTFERLAAVGLGFDAAGKMTLDEKVFTKALDDAPTDVQTLVSGANGNGGAFGALAGLIDDYTDAGGLISESRERIDEQVRGITRRLDGMEAQLNVRRQALQKEYMAADLAMSRIKAQSASLSSVGSGYRLF